MVFLDGGGGGPLMMIMSPESVISFHFLNVKKKKGKIFPSSSFPTHSLTHRCLQIAPNYEWGGKYNDGYIMQKWHFFIRRVNLRQFTPLINLTNRTFPVNHCILFWTNKLQITQRNFCNEEFFFSSLNFRIESLASKLKFMTFRPARKSPFKTLLFLPSTWSSKHPSKSQRKLEENRKRKHFGLAKNLFLFRLKFFCTFKADRLKRSKI